MHAASGRKRVVPLGGFDEHSEICSLILAVKENEMVNQILHSESLEYFAYPVHWQVLFRAVHVQGTPLKVAQAQLGHSHMATTLEIYTHASLIAQREAVNLLDERVFPNVPKNAHGNRSRAEGASPTN
jgi:hypothetical protein